MHVRILISRTCSVKTSIMSVYYLIGVNEEYFINIEFFFSCIFYIEERSGEDHSSYVEKRQHIQGGRPIRHRGLNECEGSFFFSLKLLSTLLRH